MDSGHIGCRTSTVDDDQSLIDPTSWRGDPTSFWMTNRSNFSMAIVGKGRIPYTNNYTVILFITLQLH